MQAEIVVIGTELLLGQIIDTNAAYLAQQLSIIGVNLFYKSTVGDNQGPHRRGPHPGNPPERHRHHDRRYRGRPWMT